jgi:CRISPR-associated protein Csm3
MKREKIIKVKGTIFLESGTHIGGSQDELEIGGTDNPAIKHPVTGEPYLPGSSLKGRMRCELERELGQYSGKNNSEPCGCGACAVCRVFGVHKNIERQHGPTRIMVRDSPPIQMVEFEQKTENIINRQSGAAEHPRTIERVAAGAKFQLNVSIQVFDEDGSFKYVSKTEGAKMGADALFEVVRRGLFLVQETGLGSGVSRGSGQIRFEDLTRDGAKFTL